MRNLDFSKWTAQDIDREIYEMEVETYEDKVRYNALMDEFIIRVRRGEFE